MLPNFVLLDTTLPDVTILVAAILQAREAVERRFSAATRVMIMLSEYERTELRLTYRRNVTIEYRWAEGHNDRLSELAADLVRSTRGQCDCRKQPGDGGRQGCNQHEVWVASNQDLCGAGT